MVPGFAKFLCAGWYAVDVFVIISGFVIFYLLDNKAESYRSFLTRRFFRLWPLFILLFLISIPVSRVSIMNLGLFAEAFPDSPVAGKGEEWIHSWWDHIGAHLMIHLPMLHGVIPDKFLPMSPIAFLGPAWSISLEWQFYLLAPIVFLVVRAGNKAWIVTISLICGLMYLMGPRLEYPKFGEFNKVGAFLPMHIEFFYIGCFSYFLFKRVQKFPLGISCLPVGILSAVGIGVMAVYASPNNWDWIPYVIWLAFFSLIIDLQRPTPSSCTQLLGKVFDNPISLHLGKISYSIYLVHILVIAGCQWLIFKVLPDLGQPQHLWALALVSTLLSVVVSHFLYIWVEKPGIRMGAKFAKPDQ